MYLKQLESKITYQILVQLITFIISISHKTINFGMYIIIELSSSKLIQLSNVASA